MEFKVGDTVYFTTRNLTGSSRYISSVDDRLVGRKLVIASIDNEDGLCIFETGETTVLKFLRKTKPRGMKIHCVSYKTVFDNLIGKGDQF